MHGRRRQEAGVDDGCIDGALRAHLVGVLLCSVCAADQEQFPARQRRGIEGGDQVELALFGHQAAHLDDVAPRCQTEFRDVAQCLQRQQLAHAVGNQGRVATIARAREFEQPARNDDPLVGQGHAEAFAEPQHRPRGVRRGAMTFVLSLFLHNLPTSPEPSYHPARDTQRESIHERSPQTSPPCASRAD